MCRGEGAGPALEGCGHPGGHTLRGAENHRLEKITKHVQKTWHVSSLESHKCISKVQSRIFFIFPIYIVLLDTLQERQTGTDRLSCYDSDVIEIASWQG